MKNTIVLPTGQARISVGAALKEIVNVAKFPPAVSIFVEIFTDGDGNESSPDDAQVRCEQTDGRGLATHKVKASFLSFCESTGTKPRNPYAPWVFDYDGANGYHDCLYEITIDELRKFASEYSVDVATTDDDALSLTPADASTLPTAAAVPASKPQAEPAEGITKAQVLDAFDMVSINLKKALGDGKGLFGDDGARTNKGTRGGKHAALWDPVILAIGLHEKYNVPLPHLKKAFFTHPFLNKWSDKWGDALEKFDL